MAVSKAPAEVPHPLPPEEPPAAPEPLDGWPETLPTATAWEHMLIREAMRRTGNASAAARLVGIGKTTVYRKLKAGLA